MTIKNVLCGNLSIRFLLFAVGIIFLIVGIAHSFSLDINKILDIGKSTKKALIEFSEVEQYYIGRSVGANILTSNKLYYKKEIQKYVSSIGQTLVMASKRPETFKGYHFIVLDEPERVNAYAVPSGFIFITTGLIAKAENEEELAGIIAHEIAHVALYHPSSSIKKSNQNKLKKALLGFAADQFAGDDQSLGELVEGLNEITGILVDSAAKGYSREKENEADIEGLRIMAAAGYDPDALASILLKLNPIGSGGSGTHGDPEKRSKSVQKAIKDMKYPPVRMASRTNRFRTYMSAGF